MSEKKNIDAFFQESLAHFEVTPPEMAWENIEAKLNEKKKKRRVVPFWWKLSGIAAVLLIGFGLYTTYFTSNSAPNNPIVNQQDTTNHPKENEVPTSSSSDTMVNKEVIVQNQEKTNDNKSDKVLTTNASVEKERAPDLSNKNQQNTTVAVSNDKKNTTNFNKNKASIKELIVNSNGSLFSNISSNKKKENSNTVNLNSEKVTTTAVATKVKESITNKSNNSTAFGTTNSTVDKNTININPKTELVISENKDTTRGEAEQSEAKLDEIKKIDSTKMAAVEPNALEELLKEKEKKITKEPKLNRWQVTPNVAPIYFSSLSNGSPLDEKLQANQKVYGTNYSYGLNVNYALNKKYSIRTGVHSYSVDYDTNGIVFYQNTNASKMQNLNPNSLGSYIQIDPLNNVNTRSFGRIIDDRFEGTLNQTMGYIEVPLEVSYKLFSKRFGVDVIGGVSTLFLNQNEVFIKSTSFTMKIGEASNLNTVHFSTNIGLGLKYSFFKRFDARIEPLFKYQLNTYSSGAGNFKPYVFGIYSGISYHF